MNRFITRTFLLFGLIVSLCHGQSFEFAHGIGNTGSDGGRAVATMPHDGSTVVTGYHSGTVDFDPSPSIATRSSNGGTDVFIARYDSAGNLLWVTDFGGNFNDYPVDVAIGSYSSIFVCGSFNGTVDFDPGPNRVRRTSRGGTDAFLVKFNSQGVFQWVITFGGTSTTNALDGADGIAVDPVGDVYLVGSFEGTFININPLGTAYYVSSQGDQN